MEASVRSILAMAVIFVIAQLGALLMAATVLGPQEQVFSNPDDPLIPVYYIIAIIGFTFAILFIIKKRRESLVRVVFLGAVIYTIFFVFLIVTATFIPGLWPLLISVGVTAVLGYLLLKKPEWYVVDAAGIIMAVGVIGILGISLSILPVLILLALLAVYDALSVYGTKHMVALADGVTEMKLPILLVVPKKRGYSYLEQKPLREQLEKGEEREAMFMGLGDVIIPGVLVISAFTWLSPETEVFGIQGSLLVALGTMVGALIGFSLLMRYVMKGKPQAGLPLLNGGAIAGYLVSYLLVYGGLTFGITLPW
jgi:presenilin-like A22 family membrane protease